MANGEHLAVISPLINSKLNVEPGAGTVDVLTIVNFGDEFPKNPSDGYLWTLTSKEKNPLYVYDASNSTWLQVGCDSTVIKSNVMLSHSLVISVKSDHNNNEISGASVYVIGPHKLLQYGSMLQTSEFGKAEFVLTPPENLYGDSLSDGTTQFYVKASKKDYTAQTATFYTSTSDITTFNIYLKWLLDTPSVLTLTWTDESDDHYARNFGEYKFDRLEFEKYSYNYHVFQMEPEGTNSSADVALRSIINISDELPENYNYKFMHHRFALNDDYSFNDYLAWDDFGEGVTAEIIDEFDVNKTYKQFDVVKFNGLYYRASTEIQSVSLSNSEVWEKLDSSEFVPGTVYEEGQFCWTAQDDGSYKFYIALASGRLANPESEANLGDWASVYPWLYENRDWQQNELALSGTECYRAKINIKGTSPDSSNVWSEYSVVYNHERDYAQGDVTIFQKIWYEARSDVFSRAPNRERQWKKIVSTGNFSLGRIYKANELVEFRGAYYKARFENSNVWPYDYNFWIPLRVINSDPIHSSENLYQIGSFTTYFPAAEVVTELVIAGLDRVYDSSKSKWLDPNGTYMPEASSSVIQENIWSMTKDGETYRLKAIVHHETAQKAWAILKSDGTTYEFWTSPYQDEVSEPWKQWQTNVGKIPSDGTLPTDDCVYQAKVDVPRGTPFNRTQWKQCSITDLDLEFKSYKAYKANALCIAPKDGKIQSYQALKDTQGAYPPDSPEDWKETSPILPGEVIICTLVYNTRSSYEIGDWVYYGGSFYEAIEASSNNTPFNNLAQWQTVNNFSRQVNYGKSANVKVPDIAEANALGVPLGACYTSKLSTLGNVYDSDSQYYSVFYNSDAYTNFNNTWYRETNNWPSHAYVHISGEEGAYEFPKYAYRPISMTIPASTIGNTNLWKKLEILEVSEATAYHLEDKCIVGDQIYECMQEGAFGSDYEDIQKWEARSFYNYSENAGYREGDIVKNVDDSFWECIDSDSITGISPSENGYHSYANHTATDWGYYQTAWFWWTKNLPENVEPYNASKTYYKGDFVTFEYNGEERTYKLQHTFACPSQAPGKNGFWTSIPAYSHENIYDQNDAVYSNDWQFGGTYKANEYVKVTSVGWGKYESWFESDESHWSIFTPVNYDPVSEFAAGEVAYDRYVGNSGSMEGFYFIAKTDIDNRFLNSEIYWEKTDTPQSYSITNNYDAGATVMESAEATWYRVPQTQITSLHPTVNTSVWQKYGNLYSTNYYYYSDYNDKVLIQWNGMLMEAKTALPNVAPQYETNANWRRLYSYNEQSSYVAKTEDDLPTAVYNGSNQGVCVYEPVEDLPSNHRLVSNSAKGAEDPHWSTETYRAYKTYETHSAGQLVFRKYNTSNNYFVYKALANVGILQPTRSYYPDEGGQSPNGWTYMKVFNCWTAYSKGEVIAPYVYYNSETPANLKKVFRAKQDIPITAPSNTEYWAELFDYDSTVAYEADDFVMVDHGYNDFYVYRALAPSTGIHPESTANQHNTYWIRQNQTHWTYGNTETYAINSVIEIDGYDAHGTIEHFFRRWHFDYKPWYTGRSRCWYALQQVPATNPETANTEYWEAIDVPDWDGTADYTAGAFVHFKLDNSTGDNSIREDFGVGNTLVWNDYPPRFFQATEDIVSTNVVYNTTDNVGTHQNFWEKIGEVSYYNHRNDYTTGAIVDDIVDAIGLERPDGTNDYYFEVALKGIVSNNLYYNDRTYTGSHQIFWKQQAYTEWSETADYSRGQYVNARGYSAQARTGIVSNHISYADGYYEGDHATFWTRLQPYKGYNYVNDYAVGTYVELDYKIYKALTDVVSNHWVYYVDEEGNANPQYPSHPTFWEQKTIAAYNCGKDYEIGDVVVFNEDNFGSGIWNEYDNYYYHNGSFRDLHPEIETWCRNNDGAMFRCIKNCASNVIGKNDFWIRQKVLNYYDVNSETAKYDFSPEDVVLGYVRRDGTNNYYHVLLRPKSAIRSQHLTYSDKPYVPGDYYSEENFVIVRNMYDAAAEVVFDVVLGKSRDNADDVKTARFYVQVDRAVGFSFYSYGGHNNVQVGNLEGNQPGQIYGLPDFNQNLPWIAIEVDGTKTVYFPNDEYYDYGGGFEYGWTAAVEALNGYNYPKSATKISGPADSIVILQSSPSYSSDNRWMKKNHPISWTLIDPVPEHSFQNDYAIGDIVRYESASWSCAKPIASNSLYLWNDSQRAKWERHTTIVYDFTGKNFVYDSVRNDWFIPKGEPIIASGGAYRGWGNTKRKVISYSLDKKKYWFCYFVQGAFSMYKEGFEKIIKSFPSDQPLTIGLFVDTSGSINTPARVFRNSDLNFGNIYPNIPERLVGFNDIYSWFKEFAIATLKLKNGISSQYQKGSYAYVIEDNVLLPDKGLKFGEGTTVEYDVEIDSEGVTESDIVEGKKAGSLTGEPVEGAIAGGESINSLPMPEEKRYLIIEAALPPSTGSYQIYVQYRLDTLNDPEARKIATINGANFPDDGFKDGSRRAWTVTEQPFFKELVDNLKDKFASSPTRMFLLRYRWVTEAEDKNYKFPWFIFWRIRTNNNAIIPSYEWLNAADYPVLFYPIWQPYCDIEGVEYGGCTLQLLQKTTETSPNPHVPYEWAITEGGSTDSDYDDVAYGEGSGWNTNLKVTAKTKKSYDYSAYDGVVTNANSTDFAFCKNYEDFVWKLHASVSVTIYAGAEQPKYVDEFRYRFWGNFISGNDATWRNGKMEVATSGPPAVGAGQLPEYLYWQNVEARTADDGATDISTFRMLHAKANPNPDDPSTWLQMTTDGTMNGTSGSLMLKGEQYSFKIQLNGNSDLETYIKWLFETYPNVQLVVPKTSQDERWLSWTRNFIEDFRVIFDE